MSRTLAALIGGAAGAMALMGVIMVFLWFCLCQNRSISRTSETGSSDPSVQVGRNIGLELSLSGGVSLPPESREARSFLMEDLALATKNFNDINFIGEGKFGKVYKGFLQDGMIVAIKKRLGMPTQEFFEEVRYLSSIRHRNLVSLLGYCQDNEQQMLIYEYITNGSVSSHLYGAGQVSFEKIEFKRRLSIALGAAKGLAYLHSLSPHLVHKDFKTANVLVDETFIAKVADAGLCNLLGGVDVAGSSSQMLTGNIFLAPEVKEFGRFSEKSDVYSFGVFLVELVSGREADQSVSSGLDQKLVEWAQNYQDSSNISSIIDHKMGSSFTTEGMKELIQLTVHCVEFSSERRPTMNHVVTELDRILEKEMNLTTIMGEGTTTVTLASQLFTASR
ncbi:proline-rich receptor-like protein kinase PERK3 isoform X1 [Macadamia integrifolia]|uniref:proline-rich receptor-like protein kinase PERK3 isoform X1 n=1 Tax=Macadamia integrifolia TaxID=60698 RepID=UPI001C4F21A2|nr:proline-rich receptor-like protein kinase PERK3 isoform X1 [Macadamia integrifolia]